ncbi:MAG: SPOR domain-containing protein [Pseudomonadota bacterium]
MNTTKPIAGLLLSVCLIGAAHAQSLRNGATPAEFPPASYDGNQYVDSRGCVYIRAGIDGAVTWVPRVTRDRQLVCGFTPTGTATTAQTAPTAPASGVEQITIETTTDTSAAPVAAGAASSSAAAAAGGPAVQPASDPFLSLFTGPAPGRVPSPAQPPTVFETTEATPAPEPTPATIAPLSVATATPRTPSPAPPPTVFETASATPEPVAAPAPSQTPVPLVVYRAPQASAPAPASVRAAPAPQTVTAPPQVVVASSKPAPAAQTTAGLSPNTRVLPLHVYEQRANARNLPIPKGYRAVWDDDRLNLRRAESTLAPPVARAAQIPSGFRPAWDDGRLNPNRAVGSASGNVQTEAIWTNTVPRQLKQPQNVQVVRVQRSRIQAADTRQSISNPLFGGAAKIARPAATQPVQAAKVETVPRTKPQPKKSAPRYVRVGAFASEAQARAAAKTLARSSGLTLRLGTARKGNQTYKLVLAGPYGTAAAASSALSKVRGAGYSGARMLR